MNSLPIIAALAAMYLPDPAVPSRLHTPLMQVAGSQIPESVQIELEAAFGWFANAVAAPILAARDELEMRRLLGEHAAVAAQARAAIASAVDALLRASPATAEQLEVDPDLKAAIESRGRAVAPELLRTLELASLDFADLLRFMASHPNLRVAREEVQTAMATLVPLASDAEVPLLIALIAIHTPVPPEASVLAALVDDARMGVLRHRALLHGTLRRWDSAWSPTVDAPAWADAPQRLELNEVEINNVVALLRDPPPPTEALRRALARR